MLLFLWLSIVGNIFLGFLLDKVNVLVWYILVVMILINILFFLGSFIFSFFIFNGLFGFYVIVVFDLICVWLFLSVSDIMYFYICFVLLFF